MEVIGSIIISIVQSILFYGKSIGISMILFEIIFNSVVLFILNRKNKIINKRGLLLLIPITLLSCTFAIFANKTFYLANICIILILNLLMYAILINKKGYFKNYLHNTLDLVQNTFKGYREGIYLTQNEVKYYVSGSNKIEKANVKKIAKSSLIVILILAVVLILLISADSVFASLFSGITRLFGHINIIGTFSFLFRLAIIIAVYVLSLSFILKLQKNKEVEQKQTTVSNSKDSFTIKLLLITLNIVYLIFCYIQLQSLFARIQVFESYDYASYARSGFFQLMFVSLINFVIILVSNKYNEKIIKRLSTLLVVFTTIIAISSMYRMHMYEMEYGLTYLRIFVYFVLITEILSFIPIIIYIYNKKFDVVKWCFVICISMYCIANYINIEKIIVNKNINRTTDRKIDYDYIYLISSEDSYSVLKERLEKEDISQEERADILSIILKLAQNAENLSWQESNISKNKFLMEDIDAQELSSELERARYEVFYDEYKDY